jgi:hypothetical protein
MTGINNKANFHQAAKTLSGALYVTIEKNSPKAKM